jgi:hypothetical protein
MAIKVPLARGKLSQGDVRVKQQPCCAATLGIAHAESAFTLEAF